MQYNFKIILSRTDSIGDVILTLPMAGWLKKHFPNCFIYLLGRSYTRDVIAMSEYVDEFIDYDEFQNVSQHEKKSKLKALGADIFVHVFPVKEIANLAKDAAIPLRVGTTNRIYHWLYCNKLINLSRKNSDLHEAQLNLKLLGFLNAKTQCSLDEIPSYYGFSKIPVLPPELAGLIDPRKFNLVLHPKSKGSAREWGLDNFNKLISLLPEDKYKIFISGTAQEGILMQDFLKNPRITDLTGKLTLKQLIAFINHADGLVAASTGPLHIAAALGKIAIGLFVPKRPMHPGRWMPLGKNAHFIVFDDACHDCKNGKDCQCITQINPTQILDLLNLHERI